MKILALEFSSSRRSVAVLNGQSLSVGEVVETRPGNTMRPLAMIESALRQAGTERNQIEGIAVGLGPGSYNGIRTAIALAQGWQLARGVKLFGVSSAEGIAAQAGAEGVTGTCHVVIDAQRGEFYVAGYEVNDQAAREVSTLQLTGLDEVRRLERAGEILVGPEVTRWVSGGRLIFPRAATLGCITLVQGHLVSGDKLEPIYLRETTFVKAPPARLVS